MRTGSYRWRNTCRLRATSSAATLSSSCPRYAGSTRVHAFLHFLCGAGAIVSLLLVAGFLPVVSLVLLFVLYLSLTIAGQTFLSFQWDILLLETGFLAIFFAPFCWRISADQNAPISRIGHFLLKLLLFKLMLMSGVVKLTSGDDSWWNLTALNYHYETQPLPTVLGWWAHQSPEWFRKVSTFFVLFVETVVPFFIWAPRRLRHIACALLILLQILIALTGNYCFFNLLTIALCLLLIDDAAFPGLEGQAPRDLRWRRGSSALHWRKRLFTWRVKLPRDRWRHRARAPARPAFASLRRGGQSRALPFGPMLVAPLSSSRCLFSFL